MFHYCFPCIWTRVNVMNEPDTGSVPGRQWCPVSCSAQQRGLCQQSGRGPRRRDRSSHFHGAALSTVSTTISSSDSSKYSIGVVPWRNNFQITSPTFIAFLPPATALAGPGSAALAGRRGESPSVTITNIGAADDRKLWCWCGVGVWSAVPVWHVTCYILMDAVISTFYHT